jgi:predicted Zn-dependent protease
MTGRFDESLALWRAARERWPTTPLIPFMIGMNQVCAGRLDEAEQELSQLRARFAEDVQSPLLEAHILSRRGRYAEAADLLERHRAALMVNRATTFLRELAYAAARAGQPERARRAIAELRALGDQDPPWVLFALGDLAGAAREVEDRFQRNDYSLRMALCWPGYEQMLRHPEIGPNLREVGPPPAPVGR